MLRCLPKKNLKERKKAWIIFNCSILQKIAALQSPVNPTLSQTVSKFPGKKILLIGDLILDQYIVGNWAESIAEPNIPVIQTKQVSYCLGGAANVAANITGLQGYADLIGVIGSDESATKLITLLRENDIQTSGLKIDVSRPTTTKTRIAIGSQTIMRVDCETVAPVAEEILEDLYEYSVRQIHQI